ncbi:hypothetical protein CLCR_06320 [Cladophialophora carrionii]|uniref:Uncharacterized protein n=1 Tax=Cladophialophora carrionii TaxID=86049 RepID=A0A1C1C867_9EURO|nr:hypothetical protein CLCR_06320 [Cladophialophora carrionii]
MWPRTKSGGEDQNELFTGSCVDDPQDHTYIDEPSLDASPVLKRRRRQRRRRAHNEQSPERRTGQSTPDDCRLRDVSESSRRQEGPGAESMGATPPPQLVRLMEKSVQVMEKSVQATENLAHSVRTLAEVIAQGNGTPIPHWHDEVRGNHALRPDPPDGGNDEEPDHTEDIET